MKWQFLQLIFVICLSDFVVAQAPGINWEKNLGGSDWDMPSALIQTSDGGFLVAGASDSDDFDVSGNYGNFDCWLVKLDSSGNIQWENHYGGSDFDNVFSVLQTKDKGFIMAACTASSDHDVLENNGNGDFWIVKLDKLGEIIWEKNYGGSGWDRPASIRITADGGYVILGETESNNLDVSSNNGGFDFWVLKLDSTGNFEWEQNYGGSGNDDPKTIIQTDDGGFIMAGSTDSNDFDVSVNFGKEDFWIVRLDANGQIEWEKNYGGSEYDVPNTIIRTADAGYLVAGETKSVDHDVKNNYGNGDFWVIKIDSIGTLQWEKNYGGSDYDVAYSVCQTANGQYIVGGLTSSADHDVSAIYRVMDCWILQLTEDGNIIWEKNYGGRDYERIQTVLNTNDGAIAFTGYSDSNDIDVSKNNGSNDFWVVKLAGTAVNTNELLNQNKIVVYPNPTKGNITIDFGKYNRYTVIEVVNSLGQISDIQQFYHSRIVNFSLKGPDGPYIIQISSFNNEVLNSDSDKVAFKVYKTD